MGGDLLQGKGLLEILLDIVAGTGQVLDAGRTVMGVEGACQPDKKLLQKRGKHGVAFRLIVFPFI